MEGENLMESIAHIRHSDKEIQSVKQHLLGVKKLAEIFGERIELKYLAGLAGMLHDLGKYSEEFKSYILESSQNPKDFSKRGSVDHSTAGGRWLYELFHKTPRDINEVILAEVVGNVIISHHSYLQDFINPNLESPYLKRVIEKEINEFELLKEKFLRYIMSENEFEYYIKEALQELDRFLKKIPDEEMSCETKLMFLSKVLFSILIDADRTDSRFFEENKTDEKIDVEQLFKDYYEKIVNHLNSFSKEGKINQLRAEMSESCDEFAKKPSDIYTLSIPTGGGKTFASLRYALKHAIEQKKRRIIYVIPYTTIIEQNAMEVRKVLLDDEHILEHHSNVIEDFNQSEEDQLDNELQHKLKLARDNWESPIIFTTMVQFLNVFYGKGTRDIRRLHQLTDAVIIFDEVQKVPIHCTALFNLSVNFLKSYGQSSILLCTATQPTLGKVDYPLAISNEIIGNLDHVMNGFKRVEVIDKTANAFDNDDLYEFIKNQMEIKKNLLAIVNTKKIAKELYDKLKGMGSEITIYHLSTSMCATHRQDILVDIRKLLKLGEPVICISTQLIEAGVDVSFECVVRSLAGLDSIAQAAGRCNRHGENEIQQVYVIDHKEEALDKLKEIKIGKEISRKMFSGLRDNPILFGGSILSRKAMDRYFEEYYNALESELSYSVKSLSYKSMIDILIENHESPNSYANAYLRKHERQISLLIKNSYKSAAKHFQVIEDNTVSAIVPYKEGKELIADLTSDKYIENLTEFLKKAQLYTISIYSHTRRILEDNEGIYKIKDLDIYFLTDDAYSNEIGLDIETESMSEMIY